MTTTPPPVEGAARIKYVFNDVDIPSSFLTTPPVTKPTSHPVLFAENDLPEYRTKVAFTIDNVLSPDECAHLIKLAESSVPLDDESQSPWQPARVTIGYGWEVAAPGYRVGDRIIWDTQVIADRVWERCLLADGVRDIVAKPHTERNGHWKLHSLNKRLRFLKYTENQYFRPHTDSATWIETKGKELTTHYTLHLYLNDSAAESATGEGVVGGATGFLSLDRERRVDVNPKAGSVLIFQHEGLMHEGAEVIKGVKYTVRSDVFYEWVPK